MGYTIIKTKVTCSKGGMIMLKKFELKNYKNFKDTIVIDFGKVGGYQFGTDCITDGTISKMLVYGRNATGKTNLGWAITDISSTLFSDAKGDEGIFLNADSEERTALFGYTFQFGDSEVVYRYKRLSETELQEEELFVNGQEIFKFDFANIQYSMNLSYIGAETAVIDRYIQSINSNGDSENFVSQQLPFLRWIINNIALKSDSILLKLADYAKRMIMMTVGSVVGYRPKRMYNKFFEYLEDEKELKEFEDFLNYMGVECKLVSKKLPDGQSELYFQHKRLVPFYENASSGTMALMNVYRRFVMVAKNASLTYFDEFDAFYHYEMSENVIKYFKQTYPNCQVIFTTHNTNLMTNRLMRPDCLFILSRKGNLTAICDATNRELREGHNLEKMYISGEFEAYE